MQGGYEPGGSRGPGRGIYLVRRAVFIALVIVLVAFVLPRACGVFSDPNAADSASKASRSGGGSGTSASGSGDGSGSATETGTESSSSTETSSGAAAGGEDSTSDPTEGPGEGPDAAGEDAMPATAEETIAVQRPEEAAPTGIPTRELAEERNRRAQRAEDARASRLAPPMTPFMALPLLPERRAEPTPDRDERVRVASETVPVERPAPPPTPQRVTAAQPAPVEPGAEAVTATGVEPAARIAGGRVARAGSNVAYAPGGGVEDGGSATRTVANARNKLTDITPARDGARAAVRGALGDAGSAVRMAESLDQESTGGGKNRCKKKPQRCASALLK